jgi:hypothetical protein
MNDLKLIDSLNNASSLDLFRLSAVIERLLADPKRILAIRRHLNLGQAVRFFHLQKGELQEGRVIAMSDRHVTIQELGSRQAWKLPYAAVEPPSGTSTVHPSAASQKTVTPVRADFRCGDRVSFEDRYLQTHIGLIVRINSRTATVEAEGQSWRVPFALLRVVLDAQVPISERDPAGSS